MDRYIPLNSEDKLCTWKDYQTVKINNCKLVRYNCDCSDLQLLGVRHV